MEDNRLWHYFMLILVISDTSVFELPSQIV